jgi:hypothetical protein
MAIERPRKRMSRGPMPAIVAGNWGNWGNWLASLRVLGGGVAIFKIGVCSKC